MNILASEYSNRVKMIHKYFINTYKWKINEDGDYQYFKNPKRCLKELQFIIDIIFDNNIELIDTIEYTNYENKLIGYSIVGKIEVKGDFNGVYQGEGCAFEYVKISLTSHQFSYNSSSLLESVYN